MESKVFEELTKVRRLFERLADPPLLMSSGDGIVPFFSNSDRINILGMAIDQARLEGASWESVYERMISALGKGCQP